jgi:hypothetical protein
MQLDTRALSPGWSCLGTYCFTTTAVPAGQTASVEYVIQEPVFDFGAYVQASYLAPDPNLANNQLLVTVP